eukprot:2785404-Amphidinium_carterae.1
MVLTQQQFTQCSTHGAIPGYKDARGDNVHRRERMRNLPEYAVNLRIHTRWNIGTNDTYNSETPMYLLCWSQTMPHILIVQNTWGRHIPTFTTDVVKTVASSAIRSTLHMGQTQSTSISRQCWALQLGHGS